MPVFLFDQNTAPGFCSDPRLLMNMLVPTHRDRPADLGPNQIAWCRANIKHFSKLKDMADAAHQHARDVAEAVRSAA